MRNLNDSRPDATAERAKPQRSQAVRRTLEAADIRAEQLIGAARMIVAVFLMLTVGLAANAPGRPDNVVLDALIAIARLSLLIYFLIGLAAVVLVRTGRFRAWMAWPFALADIAIAAINVWIALQASNQSTLLVFTTPSVFLLVFVLATGALRFLPVLQGVMTALAVSLVVLIAFSNPRLDTLNTPETLERILISNAPPPIFIRLAVITAMGLVIALAVGRGRRLIEQVARDAEERGNLTRFLPGGISKGFGDAEVEQLRQGQGQRLTIMFVDIRGFTSMTEMRSPQSTSRFLTDFRSHVLDCAMAHNGIVDKFIGDGALLVFGLKSGPAVGAREALAAADALLYALSRWSDHRAARGKPPVRIGIGVHHGEVVVGVIGDDRRLEFTVLGDEVNVAARLEQLSKEVNHPLVVSAETLRVAGVLTGGDNLETTAAPGWQDLGDVTLRGRHAAERVWGRGVKAA